MILQKLREFMYGRYGGDQLSIAIAVLGFVLHIVYTLSGWTILYFVSLVVYGFGIFRILSKNITKRRKENEWFMNIFWKIKNLWNGIKADFEERKNYKHFRCPNCKQKIRIPRGRGKVEIRCPKCAHSFIKKV